MGLLEAYPGVLPNKIIREELRSHAETARRQVYAERIALLTDKSEGIVHKLISQLFTNRAVQDRMKPFAGLAVSQAVFKRDVNEVARPVYSIPPTRYVSVPKADGSVDADQTKTVQETFAALVKETRLNARMNYFAHRLKASNHAFTLTRYVKRLKRIVIDVITPDCCTVKWDPDDQCKPLSFTYDMPVRKPDGSMVTWHVTYDDEIVFWMDENDNLVPQPVNVQEDPAGQPVIERRTLVRHGYPRMPVVAGRLVEGYGWDDGTGLALIAADKECKALNLLSMRLLKAQGFNRDAISGEVTQLTKGMVQDEESAIVLPPGTTVQQIGSKQDAAHYIEMLDSVKNSAAADEGISRARLNQDNAAGSDDTGLMESRAEMIKAMLPVEMEQFEVLKMVSAAEHPELKMPLEAMMEIDFGELQHRVDRKAQLEIWETELSKGLRSIYDCIREDNPEIRTDEEAKQEIQRNAESYAWFVDLFRKLNVRTDGGTDKPGQTPEENGAMGPPVRDGKMTRDEAAEKATGADYEKETSNASD